MKLVVGHGESHLGEPSQQGRERDLGFHARQRRTEAEVDAVAEREMAAVRAVDVERRWIVELRAVAVGRRRFRSTPASRTGVFTVAGIPAGEYFIVAVPDEAANEWQEASRLEALSAAAQRVTLVDGDRKTMEIKR